MNGKVWGKQKKYSGQTFIKQKKWKIRQKKAKQSREGNKN
jgi:hypothetical protein